MVCDCGASGWGFFCGCFCCACGGCTAWTAAGFLRLLCNPSGCVFLFCSCAGGVGWAAAFSFAFSVPCLRRLAWQCSLGASPCEVAFRGGLLALVLSGYAKEVVTSLCLGVLWCLRTPQHFQTLVLAMSGFDFISCALLGVDLSASYLVGSSVFVGVPPLPGVILLCRGISSLRLFLLRAKQWFMFSPSNSLLLFSCFVRFLASVGAEHRSLFGLPLLPDLCASGLRWLRRWCSLSSP